MLNFELMDSLIGITTVLIEPTRLETLKKISYGYHC